MYSVLLAALLTTPGQNCPTCPGARPAASSGPVAHAAAAPVRFFQRHQPVRRVVGRLFHPFRR